MQTLWTPLAAPTAQVGESPFWHSAEGRLYWVDIAGRALWRSDAEGGDAQRWSLPAEPGCIAPARRGGADAGLVVTLRDRICHAPVWGGPLNELARLPIDPATERANDGKCDALGRLWVGTVHEPASGPRQPVAALYCVDLRASPIVRSVLDGVRTANGLAWSPDGHTLYWTDTPAHAIRAWECDAAGEPVGTPRTLRAFEPRREGVAYGGRPDGACVDAEGAYWCALYEGARVLRLSPAGGVLAELPLPVECPTMPCLGGPDRRTLFVTSARRGDAGGQVWCTRVEVPGLPVAWCDIAHL